MARRGKLFKHGPARIIQNAVGKINASVDVWRTNTIAGFENHWSRWINIVQPELARTIVGLPARTGNIRTNVTRRVIPVAETISRMSAEYRRQLMQQLLGAAAGAAPAGGGPG